MSRPKNVLQFQGTTTPKLVKISLKTLATTELRFSAETKRKLDGVELDNIQKPLESEIKRQELSSERVSLSDGEKLALDLIDAAKKLEENIRKYRSIDNRGTNSTNTLAYLIGTKPSELTASLRPIRAIARASSEDLLGKPTEQKPTAPRNKLARRLLALFEKADGVLTKTKSAKGQSSSLVANWLVEVGNAIRADNPNLAEFTFTTEPSAEAFVANYLTQRDSKES